MQSFGHRAKEFLDLITERRISMIRQGISYNGLSVDDCRKFQQKYYPYNADITLARFVINHAQQLRMFPQSRAASTFKQLDALLTDAGQIHAKASFSVPKVPIVS